ncbi:MAG: peptidoglycan DD-metalloendopeptidase family protein [bacterium]|nr:peptidoglycan DD-metalloendopeptidase family protein [bacterium]
MYWIAKVVAHKPITIIYRSVLRTRFRLAELDIHLKNPLTYPLVSKSVGGIVLLLIGIGIFMSNVDFATADPDITLPRNLLVSYVSSDLDATYIEGTDQIISASGDNNTASVSARAIPETGQPIKEPTDTSDIANNSGSLIKPNIPTEEAAAKSDDTTFTYVVQTGDTIGAIAQKFEISSQTLIWANNLSASGYIRPGQKLVVLPVDGILYKVKSGDTLLRLARVYGTDVPSVVAQNRLTGANDIHIGETLILPGGVPPTPITPSSSLASRIKETVTSSVKPSSASSALTSGIGMIWPTTAHTISQYFSWRHTGVDIAGPISNTIFAAQDGTVLQADASGYNGGYGKTILLSHANGIKTRYGHASKLFVTAGQHVKKGEAIAMVGSTGRSTGPHLHFEVIVNGTRVNPFNYIHR